jgi:hypothetical protein
VLDPRIPDGFHDVHDSWDLDDVAHAISLLDQLDAITRRREASNG